MGSLLFLPAAPVGAQSDGTAPTDNTSSTDNPSSTSTTKFDPNRPKELEAQVSALEKQLGDLDASIPVKQARAAQLTIDIEGFDTKLADIEDRAEQVQADREGPTIARRELALALYTQGPVELTVAAEFIRTGKLTANGLRGTVLFEAAEEAARQRLAELTEQAAQLATEADNLRGTKEETIAIEAALQVEIAADLVTRDKVIGDIEVSRTELKDALLLAQRAPLSGIFDYPIRPAIGVKIDNSIDARPQTGLTKADVVYDIIVEGGITRLLAVYHSQDATRIGPVRSARTSDISIMAALNQPIFAYSGGNSGVLAAVEESPMISLTESSARSAFVRDEGRFAPHNLYTSTAGLYRDAEDQEPGVPGAQFQFRFPGEASALGRAANGVSVSIGIENVSYSWNGSSWDRATGGRPTEDTTAGQVSPQNVIVMFTNYAASPADAASPDARTVGSGDAWIFTDGKVIEARWVRGTATAAIQYVDGDNKQIPLTPGQTWVELPRPGGATIT
ncbi:MAG: DUF3048 domain-containing protein [Acidimicrobiales bacterium]